MSAAEHALAGLALGLIADPSSLSPAERKLHRLSPEPSARQVDDTRAAILAGEDPLGSTFASIRSPELRREKGATYTPAAIVKAMMDWAAAETAKPVRVVDPGAGSGRFVVAAAAAFPEAHLVAVEIDPLAVLMLRANAAVLGFAQRLDVIVDDYRNLVLPRVKGPTLFIGNPPYVRHHEIEAKWKDWLADEAAGLELSASKLAGLHVHFFLATAKAARPKDFGAFITASEWLDVNYGSLVRSLMLGRLGGKSVTVVDPKAQPFPDAATTAAISTFQIGAKPRAVLFDRIESLDDLALGTGRKIGRDRLAAEKRWSHLTHATEKPPEGYVELGEICRVHRGTVTGANDVWIAGEHSAGLPESVLFPTITRAREVLEAQGLLADGARLKRVIDLPTDLDELDTADRKAVMKFLKVAKAMGADKGYIARHRKAWWSVGLRAAAPIISTYMARRPPGFAINGADARHINIAHGLYPREPLTDQVKLALVKYLQSNISQRSGRTYAGGLTKFEPREMERLIVPGPELLKAGVAH